MLGCTNPAAENYDPAADEDDGSCVYLTSINGQCLQFEDAGLEIIDNSFTLSFDTIDKKWSFYHDYFPDFYIHTRKALYNISQNKWFEQNAGPRGLYHDRYSTKPFFIDILFVNKETTILNSVNWISEVRNTGNREADDNAPALYNETITAITIWNNYQTSGKIILDKNNPPLLERNNRNSEQNWNFNEFRNRAKNDAQFLDTLFNNFAIRNTGIYQSRAWFKKELMEGKYFIVRFEFINTDDKQITLHDVDIDADVSYRA